MFISWKKKSLPNLISCQHVQWVYSYYWLIERLFHYYWTIINLNYLSIGHVYFMIAFVSTFLIFVSIFKPNDILSMIKNTLNSCLHFWYWHIVLACSPDIDGCSSVLWCIPFFIQKQLDTQNCYAIIISRHQLHHRLGFKLSQDAKELYPFVQQHLIIFFELEYKWNQCWLKDHCLISIPFNVTFWTLD